MVQRLQLFKFAMICRFANRKLPLHSTCHRSWQLPVSRCIGKTAWKFHKCCTACPLGLPNSPNSLPKPGSANAKLYGSSQKYFDIHILSYSDIFWSYSAGIGVLRRNLNKYCLRSYHCMSYREREREQVKRQYFARLRLAHHHRQRRHGPLAAKRHTHTYVYLYILLLSHVWI